MKVLKDSQLFKDQVYDLRLEIKRANEVIEELNAYKNKQEELRRIEIEKTD